MTGDQIRGMRKGLKLTQTGLAQAVGVSMSVICLWESRGEKDATPQRQSRKWDALVAFLSLAQAPRAEQPKTPPSSAGLLWPWLPTAGPEYRAQIHAQIHGAGR